MLLHKQFRSPFCGAHRAATYPPRALAPGAGDCYHLLSLHAELGAGSAENSDEQDMDDHFWPAMYPGLIVGILYGLSLRGVANTIVAAVGGLLGAAVAYEILTSVNINDGLPSVLGLTITAFLGAYLLTSVARRFMNAPSKS
jgi:xanthosine utilization system XapX-like protein